jgi:hypothetical protein
VNFEKRNISTDVSYVTLTAGDLTGDGVGNYIPPMAFILAGVASCNSVGAAVFTESLFKVRPTFLE